MEITRRNLMVAGVAASAIGAAIIDPNTVIAAEPDVGALGKSRFTADQALARLKDGNRGFIADEVNTLRHHA